MNQMILMVSDRECGIRKMAIVVRPTAAVPILTQGRNFCPFLKLCLSTMYPKIVSLTASQTLGIIRIAAALAAEMPMSVRKVEIQAMNPQMRFCPRKKMA